jgi:hypothetical protein
MRWPLHSIDYLGKRTNMLSWNRSLRVAPVGMVLFAGLIVAACGDTTAPVDGTASFKRVNTATLDASTDAVASEPTVRGKPTKEAKETAAATTEVPPYTIMQSADAPRLMTYDTTFTAIQGQGNTFVVFYQNPWTTENTQGDWFMKLDVPSDAQFVNEWGEPYADGAVVEITVLIDETRFFVQFGPHGSTFLGKQPAVLMFNYLYADLGDVDPANLKVFYQPSANTEWAAQTSVIEKKGNRILLDIYHFSNYAVAWFF